MTDVTVKMLAGTAPQVTVTGMTLVVNPVAGVASVNGHTDIVTLTASDVGADAAGAAAAAQSAAIAAAATDATNKVATETTNRANADEVVRKKAVAYALVFGGN